MSISSRSNVENQIVLLASSLFSFWAYIKRVTKGDKWIRRWDLEWLSWQDNTVQYWEFGDGNNDGECLILHNANIGHENACLKCNGTRTATIQFGNTGVIKLASVLRLGEWAAAGHKQGDEDESWGHSVDAYVGFPCSVKVKTQQFGSEWQLPCFFLVSVI